jgi:hypothetical protein
MCDDWQGGAVCKRCISSAYLLDNYNLCTTTFPNAADNVNCHPDKYCVSPCPNNLYFELSQSTANSGTYDWVTSNTDINIKNTNVCYLCHRYCLTCTDMYDHSCTACAYSFYKWQQGAYGNRCGYYCKEGSYTAGGLVGEYVDPVFGG